MANGGHPPLRIRLLRHRQRPRLRVSLFHEGGEVLVMVRATLLPTQVRELLAELDRLDPQQEPIDAEERRARVRAVRRAAEKK